MFHVLPFVSVRGRTIDFILSYSHVLEGQEIAFTNTVKCLGVLLDPKLNWEQHLIESKKFYSSMWVCSRVTGKTWWINSNPAFWMYNAILLPNLLHASVAWWPRVSRVETRYLL
jgi:hypothetical protein